jgi:hypothetical protein
VIVMFVAGLTVAAPVTTVAHPGGYCAGVRRERSTEADRSKRDASCQQNALDHESASDNRVLVAA